jgi:hypothetical protein
MVFESPPTDTKPTQIDVVREGVTEVVDLDHVTVHLNTVLAPDFDLLHRCLVYFAGYRALAQVGNQVRSLACLVAVMVDTAPVATNTAVSFENVALPQRGELTTCRAHVNEFVRDDIEVLVDDRTWYPEGRELGMHISVWHCATAGAAVACAVVDAVASSRISNPRFVGLFVIIRFISGFSCRLRSASKKIKSKVKKKSNRKCRARAEETCELLNPTMAASGGRVSLMRTCHGDWGAAGLTCVPECPVCFFVHLPKP